MRCTASTSRVPPAPTERRREEAVSTRPLLAKLGIHPGSKVLLVALDDHGFRSMLQAAGAQVQDGGSGAAFDAIFLRVERAQDLAQLSQLRERLEANGAVWVVRRKGAERTVHEEEVMAAAQRAGLVDVKVVSFSATESALKLVIPVRLR